MLGNTGMGGAVIKATIVACAVCASAYGTFALFKAPPSQTGHAVAANGMLTIADLHAIAHRENLKNHIVDEPY